MSRGHKREHHNRNVPLGTKSNGSHNSIHHSRTRRVAIAATNTTAKRNKQERQAMISQEYFDETLLESQELFEYDDDQAVEETAKELRQSASAGLISLEHLTLTHPNSDIGKAERQWQTVVKSSMAANGSSDASALLGGLRDGELTLQRRRAAQHILLLFLQSSETIIHRAFNDEDYQNQHGKLQHAIDFILQMLPSDQHPLTRQLRQQLMPIIQHSWCGRLAASIAAADSSSSQDQQQGEQQEHNEMQVMLFQLARSICNFCEPNKKAIVQALLDYREEGSDGMDMIVNVLRTNCKADIETKENEPLAASVVSGLQRAKELCLLLRVLGTFQSSAEPAPQDGEEPIVSSAHATMLELHKHNVLPPLHRLSMTVASSGSAAKNDGDDGAAANATTAATDDESANDSADLLSAFMSALRVIAIDNDMVQNMVALGILDTIHASLRNFPDHPAVVASTLGLLRNLCANDEIKTTVCRSSLGEILHVLQEHGAHASVQENGCGILTAMALREPNNARSILNANGMTVLVQMMERFPGKVSLQRQCALAVRNIVSRLSEAEKTAILDNSSVENVLRNICGRHQGSVEESYAALRDLGCEVTMYKVNVDGSLTRGTEEFGKVKSNFRREYD